MKVIFNKNNILYRNTVLNTKHSCHINTASNHTDIEDAVFTYSVFEMSSLPAINASATQLPVTRLKVVSPTFARKAFYVNKEYTAKQDMSSTRINAFTPASVEIKPNQSTVAKKHFMSMMFFAAGMLLMFYFFHLV